MIGLIISLALLGFILWAVETYVPMSAPFRTLIRILVVILVVLYLINVFGLLQYDMPIPRVR